MRVSVFGNPDVGFDNVPYKILPELKKLFPEVEFEVQDPNELDLPAKDVREWVILDTVQGLKQVKLLSFEEIAAPNYRTASHDFDLSMHLHLVKKLNKGIQIHILGVPMQDNGGEYLKDVCKLLKTLSGSEKFIQ